MVDDKGLARRCLASIPRANEHGEDRFIGVHCVTEFLAMAEPVLGIQGLVTIGATQPKGTPVIGVHPAYTASSQFEYGSPGLTTIPKNDFIIGVCRVM